MSGNAKRFYRQQLNHDQMTSFITRIKETDLWIAVDKDSYTGELPDITGNMVWQHRTIVENYIKDNPGLATAMEPFLVHGPVPETVMRLVRAGNAAGVGPMAAVAGVFAEITGLFLLENGLAREVIVENGGDIFLKMSRPALIGIYAGDSVFSGKLGLAIEPAQMPCGVCTSSGKVGPSFSRGVAEAVVVTAETAALADAVATAAGNIVQDESRIEEALAYGEQIKGIRGMVVICGERIGVRGDLQLCPL